MLKAFSRRGASFAAILSVAAVIGCTTPEPPPPPPAPPPPPPPPPSLALNSGVTDSASVYLDYIRQLSQLTAGFADVPSIRSAISTGAAYEPAQLSRGMIAYGAVLALQSPEFVAGVRTYVVDPTVRDEMIRRIAADSNYAASLPGADAAAGVIAAAMARDMVVITAAADAIEADSYTIQGRSDPRRRWATQHQNDRPDLVSQLKLLAATQRLSSSEESARLMTAALAGDGLDVQASLAQPPYTPAIAKSLAIAALAALGAGGEDARANTEALAIDPGNETCLNWSKLNLYQCVSASKPAYEDMFCLSKHIVRDVAMCTAEHMTPVQVALPVAAPTTTLAQSEPVAANAVAVSTDAVESGAATGPN